MFHRALACALISLILVLAPAAATAKPQRPEVQAERREVAAELRRLLRTVEDVTAVIVAGEDDIARLRERQQQLASDRASLQRNVEELVRTAVMHGGLSESMAVLGASDANEAVERAQFVASMTRRDTAAFEEINAARRQLDRLVELIDARVGELRAHRKTLKQTSAEVSSRLDELRAVERRLQRRARRQHAASHARPTSSAAPSSGGYACIQAAPYSFIDSWGAPRSGGRSHQGTDVMAPYDNEVYAFTAGRVSRMTTGGIGGITLWLEGDDGASYYYAHLSRYAAGVAEGTAVKAGQLIAFNGDSGNAAGTPPHVHFEAHPGGGAVNPYPMLRAACP